MNSDRHKAESGTTGASRRPSLSVCIPTYNRCDRLRKIISVLLKSKFENFEIVISDDASTDGTWKMLEEFVDSRVRCYRNEQNAGVWPNWNVVVQKADSPLIFRMDDDDYVDDMFLKCMVDLFNQYPDVLSAYSGFAYTRAYDFSRDYEVVDHGVFAGRDVISGPELIRSYLLHNPFPGIHPASVVYRREAGEQVGFYRSCYNDQTFAMALAACGKVGYVPAVHFYYVQHDDGRASNAQNRSQMVGIRNYDPLGAAKSVYESDFETLRNLPDIQDIKAHVYKKHLRLYPCIEFYTVRKNFHRRRSVAAAFFWMARRYPSIMLDPVVWAAFLTMLLPMTVVDKVMRWYREGRLSA